MIILYYISIIIFSLYIIGCLHKHGIPESLSETAYLNKNGFVWFSLFCLTTSLPLMIFWLTITAGQTFQFLVFLSCMSLIGVGVAGRYKDGMDRKVHMISAGVALITSMLWAFIYTPIWPISLLLASLAIAIGFKVKGKRTEGETENSVIFFGEMAAFVNMFMSTYLYYIMML